MSSSRKLLIYSIYIFLVGLMTWSVPAWGRKNSSIVICAETGKIYTASNPDLLIPPSSLTKMMTLYLAFKALRDKKISLHQELPVSAHASVQEPCKLWLKKGSTITLRQAILGMVTKSANDAAVVLAEALGKGSEKVFAEIMTEQARRLGMKNTVFKNASGLPNKFQITTARDIAILSRALYRHFPEYFKFFGTKEFKYGKTVYKNHNHLLGKIKGVDGIKTGFTCASGFNLAASMVRDNRRIIAVVLGGETRHARDQKMVNLLEATHAQLCGRPGKNSLSIKGLLHAHSTSVSHPPKKRSLALKKKQGLVKARKPLIRAKTYKNLNDLFRNLSSPSRVSSLHSKGGVKRN